MPAPVVDPPFGKRLKLLALPSDTNWMDIKRHAQCRDVATHCDHFASMSELCRGHRSGRETTSSGALPRRRDCCFILALWSLPKCGGEALQTCMATRCRANKLDSPQYLVLASAHRNGTREGDLVTARSMPFSAPVVALPRCHSTSLRIRFPSLRMGVVPGCYNPYGV